LLGNEHLYGPHAHTTNSREVMLRVVADHHDKHALELFAREIAPAGTSWAPGTTNPGGTGRPVPVPLIKPFAFFLPKDKVAITLTIEEQRWSLPSTMFAEETMAGMDCMSSMPDPEPWTHAPDIAMRTVPLIALAWARSGDKGDQANIGVIARRPEWLPLIWASLQPSVVAAHFAHLLKDGAATKVRRYHVSGIHGLNLVLPGALAGGGAAAARFDQLGKGFAQMLLDMPVQVPAAWLDASL
jgi:hypothetical protein